MIGSPVGEDRLERSPVGRTISGIITPCDSTSIPIIVDRIEIQFGAERRRVGQAIGNIIGRKLTDDTRLIQNSARHMSAEHSLRSRQQDNSEADKNPALVPSKD